MATSLTVDDGTSVVSVVDGVTVDALGRLTERSYGNGVSRSLVWGRDSSLEQALVTFLDTYETEPTNVVVQWDEYLRETIGRVGAVVDHVDDTAMCYGYDPFNRLTEAHTAADVTGLGDCGTAPQQVTDTDWVTGSAPYAASWAYSPAGHMTHQTLFSIEDSIVSMDEQVFTYADTNHPHAVTQIAGDQTNTYTYDTAGRLTTRTLDETTMSLEWDAASNLVQTVEDGVTVRYVYDAGGQRVARITGTTATAYLGSTEIIDTDTSVTGGVEAVRYVSFSGASVAIINGNGMWLTFSDIQGSATVTITYDLDPANRDIQRNFYAPYGTVRIGEIEATERGWLGQTLDTATGLQYLNARYYDPTTARFISPDPLLNPRDPRMLDAYMYANNNPITFHDATGLCAGLTGNNYTACAQARQNYGSFGNSKSTRTPTLATPKPPPTYKPKCGSSCRKGGREDANSLPTIGEPQNPELPNWVNNPAIDYFTEEQLNYLAKGTEDEQARYIYHWLIASAVAEEYLESHPDKDGHINAGLHAHMYNELSTGYSQQFSANLGTSYHQARWSHARHVVAFPQSMRHGFDLATSAVVRTAEILAAKKRIDAGHLSRGRIDAGWVRSHFTIGDALAAFSDSYLDLGAVSDFTFNFD